MATEVILPVLGETMNEGTIVAWVKQEGEAVKAGDVLYSVESDKATLEVEAPAAGFLRKILAPAGTTVPVLSVVGYITATPDEVVSTPAAAPASAPRPTAAAPSVGAPAHAGAAPSAVSPPAGRLVASPRARRAARERGIDLARIAGSGPGGRIVERDLEQAALLPRLSPVAERVAGDLKVDLSRLQGSGPGGRVTRRDVEAAARAPAPAPAPGVVTPFTRTQRIMAERMIASFTSAPHFYLHAEVNALRLLAMRQELLPMIEASHGLRVTISDLLVLACARALAQHPNVMAQYTPEGLRAASAVNVGLAADTPNGLVVPVIHNADRLSLPDLVRTRTELVERARVGKSLPQDFDGGVFTLSNLGAFRVDEFDAILNPPQAAILAVGRIADRPYAEGSQLALVPTMKLSLSVDHRVLDGAAGARFLDAIVSLLEAPSQVLA